MKNTSFPKQATLPEEPSCLLATEMASSPSLVRSTFISCH